MKFFRKYALVLALLVPFAGIGGFAWSQAGQGILTSLSDAYLVPIQTTGAYNNATTLATLRAYFNSSGNAVTGVAAGYKVARGETALDGANPTPVATGLTTIVACTATIKSTAAPGVDTSVITYGTSTATLNLYGWKVTSSSDTTLIASTGTDTVGWSCIGT